MIVLGNWAKRPVAISVKPNCLTISIDNPAEASVFSYDYAGRLWTAFLDGIAYRRGLDGKMVAKRRLPGEERERRWLSGDEACAIEARARQQVFELYAAIQDGTTALNDPLPPAGRVGFEQIAAFDQVRSQADAAQYGQVYKPVGILPPDQYMAVVVQATEGCSFNTCNFCSFYKDRPFRIKNPAEFRSHAQAVRDFLGAGLSLRRTIFLGDANALVVPMPKLLPLVEVVQEVFDVGALGGLYAFLDGFSGEKKTADDYRRLAERGLKRVYLGLESGNDALLAFLKKPGKPEDGIQAVRAMKAGGVAVGVIVLLGAGGQTYAVAHIADTIRVLNAMELDENDIVYFSELVVGEDVPYAREAYQAGLQPLSAAERVAQGEAIEDGLRFPGKTPPISRYDIREFIY
ncbi:MAG TPA: radical SAM protein [Phototrophicaceae bacterium]|nr:radical SAM protein [Phototrophicaceae bacterium]